MKANHYRQDQDTRFSLFYISVSSTANSTLSLSTSPIHFQKRFTLLLLLCRRQKRATQTVHLKSEKYLIFFFYFSFSILKKEFLDEEWVRRILRNCKRRQNKKGGNERAEFRVLSGDWNPSKLKCACLQYWKLRFVWISSRICRSSSSSNRPSKLNQCKNVISDYIIV